MADPTSSPALPLSASGTRPAAEPSASTADSAARASDAPSGEAALPATATAASPSDATPAAANANNDVARAAGRGGLAVAFAKIYFIIVGLAQQVALPRVLGLDGYGALSSALSIASIAYNPIISTSIQGMSRVVAQGSDAEQPAAIRRVFSLHALMAVLLGLGFFLGAEALGARVGAPHIVEALEILSAVLFFYGLYTPLVGVLNGKKRFVHQAGLDILAATLRTVGLVGGAFWFAHAGGSAVTGAASGFVVTAAAIFLVALSLVGIGRRGNGGPSVKAYVAFIAPLLVGQVLFNLLLQADLTLLRTFAAEAAVRAGLEVTAADPYVGAYRATQLFCFLPYQLLIAVTFIIFPMLASAVRDGDSAAIARYVKTGVRLALVLAGMMVSVTSGLSKPLLRLVFGAETADLAGQSMELLTLGFGAFAIFGILVTVLNSLNRERASTAITFVAVSLIVGLCLLRVQGAPFGKELLWRTALATSTGLAVATLGAGFLVWRTAKAVAPLASVVRVLLAMALAISVGRMLPTGSRVMTLVYAAAVASLYVAVLLVSRELGGADLALVKRVVLRRRS